MTRQSFTFHDHQNRSDAYVSVRDCPDGTIGFGISLAIDGDVEVFLTSDNCKQIIALLSSALDADGLSGRREHEPDVG